MGITFNLVPNNAAASAVFVEQEAVNRGTGSPVLPRKILILGQYNSGRSPTVNVPQLVLDKEDAWTRYGRGSMLASMYEKAKALAGTVPIYCLPIAEDIYGVAAIGTIVIANNASASGTLAVYVAGKRIPVTVTIADTPTIIGEAIEAAVNADLDLPVTANNVTGTVTFTARWKGEVGNQIQIEINRADSDATPAGITVTVTDMGGVVAGANDPDIETALDNLGNTWYTDIANPYLSDTNIDAIEAAGADRIDPGVKRPFAAFTGYTDTTANFLTALSSRNSEWTTYVPVHGSPTPAYVIAAVAAGLFGRYQQATPGRPMKGITLTGVVAGDTNDLTYATRDTIVQAGGSHTYNQEDDTVTFGDLVTTRTTTSGGAATTDWRFTIIIPNLQFKIYALENTFLASPFNRAVVISDNDPPGATYAIRPKTAKAYAVALVDDWVERGLSTERDTIVSGITAEINNGNAGRIDLLVPDIPTAGLRIAAVKLEWAFLV